MKFSFYSFFELITNREPINAIKGILAKYFFFPIAEKYEKRSISPKLKLLKRHYKKEFKIRRKLQEKALFQILEFSAEHIPYYRDLFKKNFFEPRLIKKDIKYLNKIPFLTKDIINEQGSRLISSGLKSFYSAKTGGSTGVSANIMYDLESADFSSAITLYAREQIGKDKTMTELHFACKFPNQAFIIRPNKEDFKCLALNRTNIFFDKINDESLEIIYHHLCRRKPYLVHSHPSTINALARYLNKKSETKDVFRVFESSGELLTKKVKNEIKNNFNCDVVNRYGLAEFGIVAYETTLNKSRLYIFDSEVYPENSLNEFGDRELVLTGLRNYLMPLIRYKTGDIASVKKDSQGYYLSNIYGRVHDAVKINGELYLTHHIQDILDYRVDGILQFQIDNRGKKPLLMIALKSGVHKFTVREKIKQIWGAAFIVKFVKPHDFIFLGRHSKFRYII